MKVGLERALEGKADAGRADDVEEVAFLGGEPATTIKKIAILGIEFVKKVMDGLGVLLSVHGSERGVKVTKSNFKVATEVVELAIVGAGHTTNDVSSSLVRGRDLERLIKDSKLG